MNEAFPAAPYSVRSRARKHRKLPVVAICQNDVVTEAGEYFTLPELIERLPSMPSTLFVRNSAADFVAELDEHYADSYPNTWQWRASTHEREIVHPNGLRIASRVSTVIHYFGWKNGKRSGAFHRIIDPVSMYGRSLDAIWPGDDATVLRLLAWAVAIRDFCAEQGIEVRPTTGGLGAQFLTDRRFYPDNRRKVPAATNESVRERMPGNHYYLNVTPSESEEFRAYYLDQRRAHHYHARTTALPNANTLYAHGRFVDLAEVAFPAPWPGFYGLYCLDLEGDGDPAFSWLRYIDPNVYTDTLTRRFEKLFVYSNELAHLTDMGYRVTGVRAAWGSRHRDTGLARYAEFAEQQLDRYGSPRWLKQLLLATYGTLATRPAQNEAVFKLAKRGAEVQLHTGARKLRGIHTTGRVKLEPGIANVLHRGMIESATRSESIGMAQWLDGTGHKVLSIYADAVIVTVDDDLPLPPLPEPWGVKRQLNHLQFINQQAFTSGEMTKLPGISSELRKYRQRAPGHAPRRMAYDMMDGTVTQTDRRI